MLGMIYCLAACRSAPQTSSSPTLVANPPTGVAAPTTQPTDSAPKTPSDYLLTIMPKCDGIQLLDQPVIFKWPNIKQRLKELEESYQGYYTCSQPATDVASFYRETIVKPPFNMNETNWVERPEGTLGLYYHSPTQTWLYLWVVPQPADAQA
ncbi:MAG TPA: hypothetical protein VF498_07375, partial [Anaerolineales bacterium]